MQRQWAGAVLGNASLIHEQGVLVEEPGRQRVGALMDPVVLEKHASKFARGRFRC